MAPTEEPSNIRVFIHWHEQTVFAGEEVKCNIVFRNISPEADDQKQTQQQPQSDRHRLTSSLHTRAVSAAAAKGHRRSALSLSVPPSSSRSRAGSVQWPSAGSLTEGRQGHSHKRSVSIVSIGSVSTIDDHGQRVEASTIPQRPVRSHGRASSLQITPRGMPSSPGPGPQSATFAPRKINSPLFNSSYPPDKFGRMPTIPAGSSPRSTGGPRRSPRSSPNIMPEFRFPMAPPPGSEIPQTPNKPPEQGLLSPGRRGPERNNLASRPKNQGATPERTAPATRILSSTSMTGGTPRSSGEFYSISNNSSETMASEYVAQPPQRSLLGPSHLRRNSSIAQPQLQPRMPELLMMGYAQIQGSFSLDGSLVSLNPFEVVKKKAVVGGRGGGVIGIEPTKRRESGLLRSFGWGNISSSLGDFLGGGELSTIKEMRVASNSKSIPLLSTPQSILFVDLRLAPGQSREYEYTFRLPKGLPPSHKGKAMKISYSLIISTQRAGGAREQQIRSVETPFRVLGSVNSVGEILGHDLMSPYVLLQDEAQVKTLGNTSKTHKSKAPSRAPTTLNELLNYVDDLVTRPRDDPNGTLLSPSPSNAGDSRRLSAIEDSTSSREAIHLAILRSNMTSEGQQSPNRFEITRNGLRVGVVMLTRPSYRLGEAVTMAIDLADTDIPCYAIHMTLETSEKVDASLAVRSESSIQRVTRKVYVTSSDASLYSRRVIFTPTIPITATPEFFTSGVSLEWKVRVEFVVPSRDETAKPYPLLEQISQDERGGLVLAAVENLPCESFDVLVPLRVYGAVGSGLERLERDEASDEGLAV